MVAITGSCLISLYFVFHCILELRGNLEISNSFIIQMKKLRPREFHHFIYDDNTPQSTITQLYSSIAGMPCFALCYFSENKSEHVTLYQRNSQLFHYLSPGSCSSKPRCFYAHMPFILLFPLPGTSAYLTHNSNPGEKVCMIAQPSFIFYTMVSSGQVLAPQIAISSSLALQELTFPVFPFFL